VTFYRPDGDTEGKDVGWCLDNNFYEIHPGLWSGDWYYDHHPEEKPKGKDGGSNVQKGHIEKNNYMESRKEWREEREGELLDTICDGCSSSGQVKAATAELSQMELDDANMDGSAAECPACRHHFVDEEDLKYHLRTQTG
jgi:hypothetical protein